MFCVVNYSFILVRYILHYIIHIPIVEVNTELCTMVFEFTFYPIFSSFTHTQDGGLWINDIALSAIYKSSNSTLRLIHTPTDENKTIISKNLFVDSTTICRS